MDGCLAGNKTLRILFQKLDIYARKSMTILDHHSKITVTALR